MRWEKSIAISEANARQIVCNYETVFSSSRPSSRVFIIFDPDPKRGEGGKSAERSRGLRLPTSANQSALALSGEASPKHLTRLRVDQLEFHFRRSIQHQLVSRYTPERVFRLRKCAESRVNQSRAGSMFSSCKSRPIDCEELLDLTVRQSIKLKLVWLCRFNNSDRNQGISSTKSQPTI